MIDIIEEFDYLERIKVVGVGGAGCIVVDKMFDWDESISLLAVNTDARALKKLRLPRKIRIGTGLTKGLGTGGDPDIGRKAIYKERDRIAGMLKGAELVFIVAGLGGGTGTGASPIIAELASNLGAVTMAVVTQPFDFEGTKKMNQAEMGERELKAVVDAIISVPNEKLFTQTDSFLLTAFDEANGTLLEAVRAICALAKLSGVINIDFADVKKVLRKAGESVFGVGIGKGGERAKDAVELALSSPLLHTADISSGKNTLVSITGGEDLTQKEVSEITGAISQRSGQNIVLGVAVDESLKKKVKVTVIVTGVAPAVKSTERVLPDFIGGQKVYLGHVEDELDIPTFLRKKRRTT